MSNPSHGNYLNVNVRRDHFGRIVLDECESDEAHLRSDYVPPGHDRAQCRQLVEELFAPLVGKKLRMLSVDVYAEVADGK